MHPEDEDAVLAGGVYVLVFTRMPGETERLRSVLLGLYHVFRA